MLAVLLQLAVLIAAPLLIWPVVTRLAHSGAITAPKWKPALLLGSIALFLAILGVLQLYSSQDQRVTLGLGDTYYVISFAHDTFNIAILFGFLSLLPFTLGKLAPTFPRYTALAQFWLLHVGIVVSLAQWIMWHSPLRPRRYVDYENLSGWAFLDQLGQGLVLVSLPLMIALLAWAIIARLRVAKPKGAPA